MQQGDSDVRAEYLLGAFRGKGSGVAEKEELGYPCWGQRGSLGEVTELLDDLEHDRLRLLYQPIVDITLGRVVATECLLRWTRDIGEAISPERVVAFCEAHGLSQELAGWVFRRAIEDAVAWRTGGLMLDLAVNVSANLVSESHRVDWLMAVLRQSRFEPSRLTVEVTETDVIRQPEKVLRALCRLRGFGVEVAMDDFGSGNSNLDRLQGLPFTKIKVDRSIVLPATVNVTSARLVNFASMLGRALGMTVIAEGVEDAATVELLRRCKVDLAQGYYFSVPVPPDELPDVAREIERVHFSAQSQLSRTRPRSVSPGRRSATPGVVKEV